MLRRSALFLACIISVSLSSLWEGKEDGVLPIAADRQVYDDSSCDSSKKCIRYESGLSTIKSKTILFGFGVGGSKRRNLVMGSLDSPFTNEITGREFISNVTSLPFDAATTTLVFLVPSPARRDVLQAATAASNVILIEFNRSSLLPAYISDYRASSLQYILFHRWLASFTPLQAFFQRMFFLAPMRYEPYEIHAEHWSSRKRDRHVPNYEWLWGDVDGANLAVRSTKIDPFTLLSTSPSASSSLFVWGGSDGDELDKVGRRGFIEDCFSSYMMVLVSNSTMLRAGLVLAETPAMLDYLSLFSRILVGNSDVGSNVPACEAKHAGVDQGVHNVIIHLGLIKPSTLYLNQFPLALGDRFSAVKRAHPPPVVVV